MACKLGSSGLLTATAVALSVAAALAGETDPRPPPRPGQLVSDFVLFDMAQQPRRLSDFREPVLVLNFWAFWCDTWKKELPQLCELAGREQELNCRVLAVSVDGQWTAARWAHLGRAPLPFPVLLDGNSVVSSALGVRRVPTVMVLDRQRRVTWVHEAYPGNPAVVTAIRAAGKTANY